MDAQDFGRCDDAPSRLGQRLTNGPGLKLIKIQAGRIGRKLAKLSGELEVDHIDRIALPHGHRVLEDRPQLPYISGPRISLKMLHSSFGNPKVATIFRGQLVNDISDQSRNVSRMIA